MFLNAARRPVIADMFTRVTLIAESSTSAINLIWRRFRDAPPYALCFMTAALIAGAGFGIGHAIRRMRSSNQARPLTQEQRCEQFKNLAALSPEEAVIRFKTFGIEDADKRFECFQFLVEKDRRVASVWFEEFGIKDPEVQFICFKMVAEKNLRASVFNLDRMGIKDPDTRLRCYHFVADRDLKVAIDCFDFFSISDQDKKFDCFIFAYKKNPIYSFDHIEKFNIDREDLLIKLMSTIGEEVLGIYISDKLGADSPLLELKQLGQYTPKPACRVQLQKLRNLTGEKLQLIYNLDPKSRQWIFDNIALVISALRVHNGFVLEMIFSDILQLAQNETARSLYNKQKLGQKKGYKQLADAQIALLQSELHAKLQTELDDLETKERALKESDEYKSRDDHVKSKLKEIGQEKQKIRIRLKSIDQSIEKFRTVLQSAISENKKAHVLLQTLHYLIKTDEIPTESKERILNELSVLTPSSDEKKSSENHLGKKEQQNLAKKQGKQIIRKLYELLLVLQFNEDKRLLNESIHSIANYTLKEKLNIHMNEESAEKLFEIFETDQFPNALISYATGLVTLNDSEVMKDLARFANSVLDGTFKEERYRTDKNQQLATLEQVSPVTFQKWKHLSYSKEIELTPKANSFSLIQDPIKLATIRLTDDPLKLFLSGSLVKDSCQRIDGESIHNQGINGNTLGGHIRSMEITDEKGTIFRALIKISFNDKEQPVLFVEQLYEGIFCPSNYVPSLAKAITDAVHEVAKTLEIDEVVTVQHNHHPDEPTDPYSSDLHFYGFDVQSEYADVKGGLQSNGRYTVSKEANLVRLI